MVSNFLHISSQFFVILHKYHLFILEEIADKFTRLFNLLDYTYNINFPFSRTKTNKNIMLLGHWVSHTDPGWSALRWKLRPSSPSAGSAPRCAVNKLLNLESWILNLHHLHLSARALAKGGISTAMAAGAATIYAWARWDRPKSIKVKNGFFDVTNGNNSQSDKIWTVEITTEKY